MPIYPEKESKSLEFKVSLPKNLSSIVKTCVAFANTNGGEIIIGVEDQTRKIVGATDRDVSRCFEELPDSIYDSISPTVVPDIFERNIEGTIVVVIRIAKGNHKPYFLKGEGSLRGVYIRIASHTRRTTEDYLKELIEDQRRKTFDTMPSTASIKDLDDSLIQSTYGHTVSERQMMAEHILVEQNHRDRVPTQGAVIAFGRKPEDILSESYLICTHFQGITGRNIIQTRDVCGPLPEILETTLNLLQSWMETNYQIIKGRLKGKLPIPMEALREALTNALVHRKYTIPGPVKVALYSDHLEVFSPGGFPGLITINNLGDGSTYLRNPLLAKFARKMRLIEKLGSGIRLIFDSCAERSLKKPDFFEDGDFVKVVFYFAVGKKITSDLKTTILECFGEGQRIRVKDLSSVIEVSRNTITNALNALKKDGKIKRHGKGRGVYYTLNK